MALKKISTVYVADFSASLSNEPTSNYGQHTIFLFRSKGELKAFLSKVWSSSSTNYTNRVYLYKKENYWNDEEYKITTQQVDLTADDL